MNDNHNWSGNYHYSTENLHIPEHIEQVRALVTQHDHLKVLGTRHSFNGIADSKDHLMSLQHLNRILTLDKEQMTVTVEAGIKYGDLCTYLHQAGYAMHNMASLPHISVAGACATATHGSGDHNGNLATAVRAMELVTANGELLVIDHDQHKDHFDGMVVGLGGFGVVTKLTLQIVPAFHIRQDVYEHLHLDQLKDHLDDIFLSAYSVSLFTDWRSSTFNQVWIKSRLTELDSFEYPPKFYGATAAISDVHPVPGCDTVNCTEQMGRPGPAYERLPHFRMDFTPSNGAELQSEYIVPRQHAYEALCAINELSEHIAPLLFISEIRTIASDQLWMSTSYQRQSVAIHFTWMDNWDAVKRVLPLIEQQLSPFAARPHWGKLFTMSADRLQPLYAKLPDFQRLLNHYDPYGKFRNAFLDTYIWGR
jgi:xylitol oxidase